jgi:hypothetical protein
MNFIGRGTPRQQVRGKALPRLKNQRRQAEQVLGLMPHVVAELLAFRASLSLFMPLTELCPTITLPTVGKPTQCEVTSGNLARRSAASQGARENGTTAAAALRGDTAAAQLCSANFVTRLGRPRFFLGAGRSPKKDPYRPSMHIYSRRFWDWQLLRPSRRLNLASQASPWLQGRFPSRLKARKHRSLCRQAFPYGKHRASIAITFDIHESQRKKRVDNWAYAHGGPGPQDNMQTTLRHFARVKYVVRLGCVWMLKYLTCLRRRRATDHVHAWKTDM